jgi:hypothetical protein
VHRCLREENERNEGWRRGSPLYGGSVERRGGKGQGGQAWCHMGAREGAEREGPGCGAA